MIKSKDSTNAAMVIEILTFGIICNLEFYTLWIQWIK